MNGQLWSLRLDKGKAEIANETVGGIYSVKRAQRQMVKLSKRFMIRQQTI